MELTLQLLSVEIPRIKRALRDICSCVNISEAKNGITISLNAILNMDETKPHRKVVFEIENMPYDESNKKLYYYKYGNENHDYFIMSNSILIEALRKLTLNELVAIFVHEIKHILYYRHKQIADELMLTHIGNLPHLEDIRGNSRVYLKSGQAILNLYKDKLDNIPDYNFYEVEDYMDKITKWDYPMNNYFQTKMIDEEANEEVVYTYNRGVQKLAEIIYADLYDEETYWEKVKASILHTLQDFKENLLSKFDTNDKVAREIEIALSKTSIKSYQDFLKEGIRQAYANRWAGVSFLHQTLATNKVSNLQESALFNEPKVIITESFKDKLFLKEDIKYIRFELARILDSITVDVDNIESKQDKYLLLDEIHKYTRLCTEKKEEYDAKLQTKLSYNDEKRYKELVELLGEYINRLLELRDTVMKKKIQPKRYGIFVENPEGYEG